MSAVLEPVDAAPAGRSPWRDARVRFMRHRAAVASVFILALIALACVFGPMLLPNAFDSVDWNLMSAPPTRAGWHLFGTDELGRDLLVRTLIGGRISLLVGLLATVVSVTIGVVWGAVAGFAGGRVDSVMMRIVDMAYAVPYLLIAILVVTVFGRDILLVVAAIAAFSWLDMARVVRGQTLSNALGSSIGPNTQASAISDSTTTLATAARLRRKRTRASRHGLRPAGALAAAVASVAGTAEEWGRIMDGPSSCGLRSERLRAAGRSSWAGQ